MNNKTFDMNRNNITFDRKLKTKHLTGKEITVLQENQ